MIKAKLEDMQAHLNRERVCRKCWSTAECNDQFLCQQCSNSVLDLTVERAK